jgi:hypothetical protein
MAQGIKIKSEFGEHIFIKKVDNQIFIKHYDVNTEYEPYEYFRARYYLSKKEISSIETAIAKLK